MAYIPAFDRRLHSHSVTQLCAQTVRYNLFNAIRVHYQQFKSNRQVSSLTVDELRLIQYTEHKSVTMISTPCSSLSLQYHLSYMSADFIRPPGLSSLSHCFISLSYSKLIPIGSVLLTHHICTGEVVYVS
jgi:hypothetical protein